MSDLKHRTVEELEQLRVFSKKRIGDLSSKLAGERERLKWINHYIHQKTPVELTLDQIEQQLGHKVIFVGDH